MSPLETELAWLLWLSRTVRRVARFAVTLTGLTLAIGASLVLVSVYATLAGHAAQEISR